MDMQSSSSLKEKTSGAFYSGLSGVVLPIPKYKFPEDFQKSSRLTYYSSLFNSIEVNRTFYAIPNPKTFSRWSDEVPENFRFTFKLWKQISHAKDLQFDEADVTTFMNSINCIGHKRGCILIQFPASVKYQFLDQLAHLLDIVQIHNAGNSWSVAVEFRDKSWYTKDTYDLLDAYAASLVIHDKSSARSPHITLQSKTIYVRFHGPRGDYGGTYDEGFLNEYANYINDWLLAGNFVFIYFNNTKGDAFTNLTLLNNLVRNMHGIIKA